MSHSSERYGRPWYFAAILALVLLAAVRPSPVRADEGWVINQFDAAIGIQSDGSMHVVETILVDFGAQQKHGIFRYIPVVYSYDEKNNRVYDLSVESVTDKNGKAWNYKTSRDGANEVIQIGDANRTVSGAQSYKITYRVRGALNAFSNHDELYWNVMGNWPVQTLQATATVTLPGDTPITAACYQGPTGSTERCKVTTSARGASYQTTSALAADQEMTIVTGFKKGLVPEPTPTLEPKPRDLTQAFDVTPTTVGGGGAILVVLLGGIGYGWWRFGRDRQYATLRYVDANSPETTKPLFSSEPVVVEYSPPDKLRPAQLGLIVDESADALDITATIVDLAVRGYLTIAEVHDPSLLGALFGAHESGQATPGQQTADPAIAQSVASGHASLFGRRDWELTRTDKPADGLLEYEQVVLNGLFALLSPVRISDLKNSYYVYLRKAQKALYEDSVARKWFAIRPDYARAAWRAGGIGLVILGFVAIMVLGSAYGAGLIGVPILLGGILLTAISGTMSRRTATGHDVFRRTMGFREYINTAEKDRQRFNEQTNLFAEYLPYAIVFRCVEKWARAFEGIGEEATRGWYYGPTMFNPAVFAQDFDSFSSSISSAVASTPGGSGGSGFSGGSSGGGGGGGGGGSW